MELTSEQKRIVADWVAKGDSLSDVQKKLESEFKIKLTYMDVRFLVDDLGAKLKDKEPAKKAVPQDLQAPGVMGPGAEEEPGDAGNDLVELEPPPGKAGGRATVEVDRITKPGSVVSGSVTFGDGVKASWMVDMYGRLALSADKPGYRPGAEDVRAFQEALGKELRKRGF